MYVLIRKKHRMLFRRVSLKRLGGLSTMVVLLVFASCDSAKPLAVPPELIGTWKTQDSRYAGVFFKIDHGSFSFSTVEGNIESYAIVTYERLNAQQKASGSAHVLHGSRDGQKLQVSLLYEPLDGGRLKFKNQNKATWTREDVLNQ